MLETAGAYVCEKSQAATRPCRFKASRIILGQAVDREQLGNLLKEGRTDLLTQFVSKSGKPFSAFLVLQDGGKIGFEFPSR